MHVDIGKLQANGEMTLLRLSNRTSGARHCAAATVETQKSATMASGDRSASLSQRSGGIMREVLSKLGKNW